MTNYEKDLMLRRMVDILMEGPDGMTEREAIDFLKGVCKQIDQTQKEPLKN